MELLQSGKARLRNAFLLISFIAVASKERDDTFVQDLKERLKEADALLSQYAVKHGKGLGRVHDEPEDKTRFRFQRDRARIVHTRSFRRLKGKTQVFVGGKNDHFRTRLTHTMEVAGISRDVARALRLNEDLAECIALAHDLGHPPFGHAGEAALDEWMKQFGKQFEHNIQSHRIVTLLETHSARSPGLNLNREVLDGMLKHQSELPSLEAKLVNIADEIAYVAHDCEDGLRAGVLDRIALLEPALSRQATEESAKAGTSLSGSIVRILAEDLGHSELPTLGFTEAMSKNLHELHQFLEERMYGHITVKNMAQAGKTVVHALCDEYKARPSDVVKELMATNNSPLEEAIKDYVAGMTDHYALEQARERKVLPKEAGIL